MIATSKISKRTIRLENSDMFTILFRFPGVILYDIPGFVWSVIIFIFRKSTRNGQSRVNIVYFLGTPLANPRYVYYRACWSGHLIRPSPQSHVRMRPHLAICFVGELSKKTDQFHWSIILCFFLLGIILSTIDINKVFQVCELCINEVFTDCGVYAASSARNSNSNRIKSTTFQARWNTTVRSVEYRQLDHCVISHFKGDAPQLCLLVYTSFPLYRFDIVP